MLHQAKFGEELKTIIAPNDHVVRKDFTLAQLVQAYYPLYKLACEVRPKRVLEIGVRAGYSAWAMCRSLFVDNYYGVDPYDGSHGGEPPQLKFMEHALNLLRPLVRTAHVEVASSQLMGELPQANLYHVDGDHSFNGTCHDILLCLDSAPSGSLIVVDDLNHIADVGRAVQHMRKLHGDKIAKYEERDSLRGEALFWRA